MSTSVPAFSTKGQSVGFGLPVRAIKDMATFGIGEEPYRHTRLLGYSLDLREIQNWNWITFAEITHV